jgi:hypothetical protein
MTTAFADAARAFGCNAKVVSFAGEVDSRQECVVHTIAGYVAASALEESQVAVYAFPDSVTIVVPLERAVELGKRKGFLVDRETESIAHVSVPLSKLADEEVLDLIPLSLEATRERPVVAPSRRIKEPVVGGMCPDCFMQMPVNGVHACLA